MGPFLVTVVWVGWRTSWRAGVVMGALLLLVVLVSRTGFAFSVASRRSLIAGRP